MDDCEIGERSRRVRTRRVNVGKKSTYCTPWREPRSDELFYYIDEGMTCFLCTTVFLPGDCVNGLGIEMSVPRWVRFAGAMTTCLAMAPLTIPIGVASTLPGAVYGGYRYHKDRARRGYNTL